MLSITVSKKSREFYVNCVLKYDWVFKCSYSVNNTLRVGVDHDTKAVRFVVVESSRNRFFFYVLQLQQWRLSQNIEPSFSPWSWLVASLSSRKADAEALGAWGRLEGRGVDFIFLMYHAMTFNRVKLSGRSTTLSLLWRNFTCESKKQKRLLGAQVGETDIVLVCLILFESTDREMMTKHYPFTILVQQWQVYLLTQAKYQPFTCLFDNYIIFVHETENSPSLKPPAAS